MRIAPFLFLLLAVATVSTAQVYTDAAPLFTHDELTCLTTERFPVVEAVVDPNELPSLRKAQVYFKANDTSDWYFIDMEPTDGSRLRGILPKPLGATGAVDYYLFFLTGSFGTSQSAERSVRVSETGCQDGRDVLGGSTVSLTLKATVPNQLPIPPGFQPQGIAGLVTTTGSTVTAGAAAAGAGGVSGATVGVIAGVGAAAAGTAVAVSSGDDSGGDSGDTSPSAGEPPLGAGGTSTGPSTGATETPSPPTDPTPAPPPEPSVPDVSGTWLMSNQITETCYPEDLGRRSDRLMAIQQNGTSLTATFVQTSNQGNFTGTIDVQGNLTLNGRVVDTEGATSDVRLEATTSSMGSSMSGNMTTVYAHNGCVVRATFNGNKR